MSSVKLLKDKLRNLGIDTRTPNAKGIERRRILQYRLHCAEEDLNGDSKKTFDRLLLKALQSVEKADFKTLLFCVKQGISPNVENLFG